MAKQPTEATSLANRQGRGGVAGAKGYAFQEAYLVAQLPVWLADEAFQGFLLEGAGDVDVRFRRDDRDERWYVQVKDHTVAPTEFRKVLAEFAQKDRGSPGTFGRFVLACPGLTQDVDGLRQALERYRGASDTYDPREDGIMANTRSALQQAIDQLRAGVNVDFLIEKVWFDSSLPRLSFQSVCCDLFIARTQRLVGWEDATALVLGPAYEGLVTLVRASIGRTRTRDEVETEIAEVVERARAAIREEAVVIHVHNWTVETFEQEPDYVLDWSGHFDRSRRVVPGASAWTSELLPALAAVREDMLAAQNPKLIRLRGKACLSAGLALGHAFPEVGGYVIELEQRGQIWRSDVQPATGYKACVLVEEAADAATEGLVVLLNVTGDASAQVARHVASAGLHSRARVVVSPPGGPDDYSVKTGAQVVALASQAKAAVSVRPQRKWDLWDVAVWVI